MGSHLNIRSFISKGDEIKHILVDSNLDFLCLSETWLNKNSPSTALHIPGYNAFRKDRKSGKGGGLLLYVKDHISCKEVQCSVENELEHICLNISLSPQMAFSLTGVYRPPSAKAIFFDKLKTVLKECISGQEILVMDDFNVNWEDKGTSKSLQGVSNKYDLTQLIKGPTRITLSSKTQIDLIFSNKLGRVTKSFNMVTGLSDHNLTLIARKLTKSRFHLKPNTKSSQLRIPKRDVDEFDREIKNINWDQIMAGADVDKDTNVLLSKIQNLTKQLLKKSKSKGNSRYTLPWISSDIRRLMKERDNALKHFPKSNSLTDRHIFVSLRNRVIKEIRIAKSNFFVDLLQDAKGNHKLVWDCLHKLTGKGHNKATKQLEIKDNGTLYKELAEIVTIFNSHFVNSVRLTVHSPISGPLHFSPIDVSQPVFTLTDISEPKVKSIITSIKNSKSKDIFGLDSMFLKKHAASFVGPVTKIINTSFKEGKFPNDWKSAIVVPVYIGRYK